MHKEWKDRLKFPQGPKASAAVVRRPAVAVKANRRSPLALVVRGMAIALILLGLAIGAIYLQQHPDERAKLRRQGEALIAKFSKAAPQRNSKGPSQEASADSTPTGVPAAVANTGQPATAEPGESNPIADITPKEAPSALPMAGTAPASGTPEAQAASGSGESLFGPPTTTPAPGAGTPPAATPADGAASLLPGPRTHVTLIEPVKIETPYGPMEFRRGMTFPLVSQEGVDVTVRFQGRIIDIPASATDLVGEAPAP